MNDNDYLNILKNRFDENRHRHPGISWDHVYAKLTEKNNLEIVIKMEKSGGEPDVVVISPGELAYIDCSKESPKDRRRLCYDRQALESRKLHKPKNSAIDLANEIGIEILTEEQYRKLQEIEEFDLKTSSWVLTPESVRNLGGAIFCDRRFDRVFTYHNGAESYYASRGFRGILKY